MSKEARNIVVISGVEPGRKCGVFDYSMNLAEALRGCGFAASLRNYNDWGLLNSIRLFAGLIRNKGLIHLQVPNQGMAGKFWPYLLFLFAPFARKIVTYHEFSRMNSRGKLLCLPTLLLADSVIVSHSGEGEAIGRMYPFARGKLHVVPIGSNIPTAPRQGPRCRALGFFGMIGDNPQVRHYLDIVEQTGLGHGAILIGHANLGDPGTVEILARAEALGVETALDLPSEAIARLLATVQVMALPFVDGISERRGSALTAMMNGAVVITKAPAAAGSHAFADICVPCADPPEMARAVLAALRRPEDYRAMLARAAEYAACRSWPSIAEQHARIYARLGGA